MGCGASANKYKDDIQTPVEEFCQGVRYEPDVGHTPAVVAKKESAGLITDLYDLSPNKIADGTFGTVRVATNKKTKKVRIVKIYNKNLLRDHNLWSHEYTLQNREQKRLKVFLSEKKQELGLSDEDWEKHLKIVTKMGTAVPNLDAIPEKYFPVAVRLEKPVDVTEITKIQQNLDHPHIENLFEFFQDSSRVFVVCEKCNGGELFQNIVENDSFNEYEAAHIMNQILMAINYMHRIQVCYRGLRPENILLKDKTKLEQCEVKITNFRYACYFGTKEVLTEVVGHHPLMAPEVIKGEYNQLCDLWGCGILAYTMMCGYYPFYGRSSRETREAVVNNKFIAKQEWMAMPQNTKDFILRLLQPEPGNRLTAQNALNHSWIAGRAKTNSMRMDTVLKHLRSFGEVNELKKAALGLISKRLNAAEIRQLKDSFNGLDTNKDGIITYAELKAHVVDQMGEGALPRDLLETLKNLDVNGNQSIDYTEFLAATLNQRYSEQEDLCWMAFRTFDVDGSGQISRVELQDLCRTHEINEFHDRGNLSAVLEEFDKDGDEQISFEEFMAIMRKTEEGNTRGSR